MRFAYVIGATIALAAGFVACSPDSMCGCPPVPPPSAYVRGILSDAQGAPIPRTVIVMKTASDTITGKPEPFRHTMTTDSIGKFFGEMMAFEQGERLVRFWVVPQSSMDTVLVESRILNFSSGAPVFVDVNLRLNR